MLKMVFLIEGNTTNERERNLSKVAVIGAGLAGSEAALVLARHGISVDLYEMRPEKNTPAHESEDPAELVCSNSFKSIELPTAHGLLKYELGALKSPLIDLAFEHRVPAGSALAVNRVDFAKAVRKAIESNSLITYKIGEVVEPPKDVEYTIIATGPLTSEGMTDWLQKRFSHDKFNFYDAIAPIIDFDSIDMSKAYFKSRYDKGDADYINCPFTREEYEVFYNALIEADQLKARDFEKSEFFEACLPVEVMAGRGFETLCFGMMKPVGLNHPETDKRYYAVCQLRKENKAGTAFNMVGFQTRMTFPEQKRVFSLIPGLENLEFIRYGTIHRNSYLNSPELLNYDLSFRDEPSLYCAGQLTGNEGYTESVTTGHLAALSIVAKIKGMPLEFPDNQTAIGALLTHITTPIEDPKKRFSPTNINFAIIADAPAGKKLGKKNKKEFYCERAQEVIKQWIKTNEELLFSTEK